MPPTTSSTKTPSDLGIRYYETVPEIERAGLAVVDVRSEKEFARGAIPGAINVPLLLDQQRHEVGLTYKTIGRQDAVDRGLELFAQRADVMRDKLFEVAGGKPLVIHCWRGGMRSGFVAAWLRAMGQETWVIKGGYKVFRRDTLALLAKLEEHPLLVLNGRTGSGKTSLLEALPRGFPLIDFELLARHRGSAFGDFAQPEPVPTPQNFENRLAGAYFRVRHHPELLVEIENFLGPLRLSMPLRNNVQRSPMVFVSRDFDDRVARIAAVYADNWSEDASDRFAARVEEFLKKSLPTALRGELVQAVRARRFDEAITSLLKERYDRLYDKSLHRHRDQVLAEFNLTHEWEAALRFVHRRFNVEGGPA